MRNDICQVELSCRRCSHREWCGFAQMVARLQQAGLLRRCKEPDPQLVLELFHSAASRLACVSCGQLGLLVRETTEEGWQEAKTCQSCGQPIPEERLRALDNPRHCASCQSAGESGVPREPDYCPRCGEIMRLRLVNRGLTRYRLSCPSCGNQR